MHNLLFLSDNEAFAEDLSGQIKLYAPDFNVCRADEAGTFYDLVLLDEQKEAAEKFKTHSILLLQHVS